jgi:hypothetical protein
MKDERYISNLSIDRQGMIKKNFYN